MQRKNFNRGDQVKFTDDYFVPDDLGMSGIVLGPKRGVYRGVVYTFLGYIESDKSARCAIFKEHSDFITTDGFLEPA